MPGATSPFSLARARGPIAATALALALCAPGPRAPADDELVPGSGGALAVAADPPRLVLGKDAGAELHVAAPPDVEEVAITCSAGKVENVRRQPGGGFIARYRPPPERFPQVAIVSALGRGASGPVDGWLAIPLEGQGDARVRGQPGSEVTLQIGDRSFGPGRVADDGVALIPVVVPPGVKEGHQGFTVLDLEVPETSLVHAALERQQAQADRPEVLRFLVYVVAPHGASRRGEPPVVEVTRGTAAFRSREPGAWEGTWTLPPGSPGEERLTVRLDGSPASHEVLKVALSPGPAATVILTLDRTTLVAGQSDEVQLTASGYDAAGNPTATGLTLSADAGTLSSPEEAGPGAIRAQLRVSPRFGDRGQVAVSARATATGATSTGTMTLAPGPAARMTLAPEGGELQADGSVELVLTLEVRDRFDNLVAEPPRLDATSGPPPRLEAAGPGRWTVRYRPAPVEERRPVHLSAALPGARADTDVVLVPAPSRQSSPARESSLFAGAGGLAAFAGGTAGGQLLLGAELPAPDLIPLWPEQATAWRLELFALGSGGADERRTAGALLTGLALKGALPRLRWTASGTAGVLVDEAESGSGARRAGVGVAGKVALGAALPHRRASPFLELALLGGTGGPAGAFGALTLTLGLRLDLFRDAGGN